eukprot:TRINITY_DN1655_c2_g3_i1.p1 TRINITY_DN1655_c2_g3~~TRINITY_DN1655_c2_g3_i1.p1  ORF type:complete len:530 (+),score=191.29 TRINITY_DN1655_c2_g3_i1:36-1625(+)
MLEEALQAAEGDGSVTTIGTITTIAQVTPPSATQEQRGQADQEEEEPVTQSQTQPQTRESIEQNSNSEMELDQSDQLGGKIESEISSGINTQPGIVDQVSGVGTSYGDGMGEEEEEETPPVPPPRQSLMVRQQEGNKGNENTEKKGEDQTSLEKMEMEGGGLVDELNDLEAMLGGLKVEKQDKKNKWKKQADEKEEKGGGMEGNKGDNNVVRQSVMLTGGLGDLQAMIEEEERKKKEEKERVEKEMERVRMEEQEEKERKEKEEKERIERERKEQEEKEQEEKEKERKEREEKERKEEKEKEKEKEVNTVDVSSIDTSSSSSSSSASASSSSTPAKLQERFAHLNMTLGAGPGGPGVKQIRRMTAVDMGKPDPTKIARTGQMSKRGGSRGGRKNWKKRHFDLSDQVLSYYKNKKDCVNKVKPLGSITIVGATITDGKDGCGKKGTIQVCSLDRPNPFYCQPDSSEYDAWMQALTDAAFKEVKILNNKTQARRAKAKPKGRRAPQRRGAGAVGAAKKLAEEQAKAKESGK